MIEEWGDLITGETLSKINLPINTEYRDSRGAVYMVGASTEYLAYNTYQLLKGHPLYVLLKANEQGYKFDTLCWGECSAPEDWDGGPIVLADGSVLEGDKHLNWGRNPRKLRPSRCIIGYTRKIDREKVWLKLESPQSDDVKTLPVMFESEALELAAQHEWSDPNTSPNAYVQALRDLGLVKPDPVPKTPLEQLLEAVADLLPDVDLEIEQRKHGGNEEDWAKLNAKSEALRAAVERLNS